MYYNLYNFYKMNYNNYLNIVSNDTGINMPTNPNDTYINPHIFIQNLNNEMTINKQINS